jgi:uncharacterized protein (DUF2164 family)
MRKISKTIINAWITKFALTKGIIEANVEIDEHNPNVAVIADKFGPLYYHYCVLGDGKEWHRTKESAIKKAESMRLSKIKSLREELLKLEQMKFDEEKR